MSRRRRRPRRDIGLGVVVVLTFCALAGPAAFWLFGRDERLPTAGPSMFPTLRGEASLDIDYEAYDHARPRLRDIVVLQGPAAVETGLCGGRIRRGSPCGTPSKDYSDEFLIKRVVAGPGDRIAIASDGLVILNGRAADEPYARLCDGSHQCELPRAVRVPPDHFFVMGDNRPNSSDSREWGPVYADAIDGRVVLDN